MMQTPVVLWRSLNIDELVADAWCDSLHFLGSYWPGAHDAQSRIIKMFKEPDRRLMTLLPALAFAYSDLVAEIARKEMPDAIVRVLASKEVAPEPGRALSVLASKLSKALRVPDQTQIFFRSDGREPMRYVERLAGPEALRARLQYVLQDLFLRPAQVGKKVLLIDDIYNLGATVRIYSTALKQFCDVERVISVNLAATRFARGKDGRGDLSLDLDNFAALAARGMPRKAKKVWNGENSLQIGFTGKDETTLHNSPDCPALGEDRARRTLRFLLPATSRLCPECFAHRKRFRPFSWW